MKSVTILIALATLATVASGAPSIPETHGEDHFSKAEMAGYVKCIVTTETLEDVEIVLCITATDGREWQGVCRGDNLQPCDRELNDGGTFFGHLEPAEEFGANEFVIRSFIPFEE